jgi:hypothetical protein
MLLMPMLMTQKTLSSLLVAVPFDARSILDEDKWGNYAKLWWGR